MKRRMSKQGFEPFAAEKFIFQSNVGLYHRQKNEKKLIEQSMQKVDVFAKKMVEGSATWSTIFFLF